MEKDVLLRGTVRLALVAALVAGAYALIVFAHAYRANVDPATTRSFTVSGEGEVVATPDVARFTYSVVSEGDTDLASLREDNASKVNAIDTFLRESDVSREDIKTLALSVEPRYEQCYPYREPTGVCPPPTIVGYTVRQTTQVTIRNFDMLGGILGGVVDRGANTVSQLNFTIDDPTELEAEARSRAIADAENKAAAMADAGDFTVGRLLTISEGYSPAPSPFYSRAAFAEDMAGIGGGIAPEIQAGTEEITVNVTLVYEIR